MSCCWNSGIVFHHYAGFISSFCGLGLSECTLLFTCFFFSSKIIGLVLFFPPSFSPEMSVGLVTLTGPVNCKLRSGNTDISCLFSLLCQLHDCNFVFVLHFLNTARL